MNKNNSMKKISIFYLLVGIALLFSCKKLLEEHPKNVVVANKFYKTENDAISAANAISGSLRSVYQFRYPIHTTGFEDYSSAQGAYSPMGQYQITAQIIFITDFLWTGFYNTIDAANQVLKYVPPISMNEKLKTQLLGEAYFLRALSYYQLVKNFGGLPLRTEPTQNLSQIGGKRETVEKVYSQIIADLKLAELALPATSSEIGRPTLGAAKTMLADVYLVREQWADARDKANEVIESSTYSLVNVKQSSDFDELFGPDISTSTEEIFSIKFQRSVAGGTLIPQFYHLPTSRWAANGYGTFFGFPTYPLLRDWPSSDLRKEYNLYTSGPNKQGVIVANGPSQPIRFGKFKDAGAPTARAHGVDFPVYRYAETLLIYAEAASQANQGPTLLALERLNMVHRRAYGLAPLDPAVIDYTLVNQTAASFQELVLKERAYEFIVEGKRWYDLLRTRTAKQVIKAAKGIDIPNSVLLMPIPKQEIDNNPDIDITDQNPGY